MHTKIDKVQSNMQKTFFPVLLISWVSFILITSCINQEVCEDVATVPVRIGFFRKDTVATTPPMQRVDSLTIYGLGNDSIIYDNRSGVGQIELPLNASLDSCAFVFKLPRVAGLSAPPNDTVWFIYERKPILISMDCGFSSFFEIKMVKYTRYRIDSLSIEDPNVINNINEHIKIFPAAPVATP
jgi:hypothetical protein